MGDAWWEGEHVCFTRKCLEHQCWSARSSLQELSGCSICHFLVVADFFQVPRFPSLLYQAMVSAKEIKLKTKCYFNSVKMNNCAAPSNHKAFNTLHVINTRCVAHKCAWPRKQECWRLFTVQWVDCKKSRAVPFIILIITTVRRLLHHLTIML